MPRVVVSDMSFRSQSRGLRPLFPLLLIVACTGPAPGPASAPLPATAPAPELSTIVVPIRTSLASLSPQIEARVPRTFTGKETERGIDVRYDVARDPVKLEMIGGSLHSSTTIKYALE